MLFISKYFVQIYDEIKHFFFLKDTGTIVKQPNIQI